MFGSVKSAVVVAVVAACVVVVAPGAAVQHTAAAWVVAGLELAPFVAFADIRHSAVGQVNMKVQLANVI